MCHPYPCSRRSLFLCAAITLLAWCAPALADNRSIDGTGNNLANGTWGAAGTQLARQGGVAYGDGISLPAGSSRPSPRQISNVIVAQSGSNPNARFLSDWVFQWGQFMDHDLDLTNLQSPAENFNISIPAGDPTFDPSNTGVATMAFQRSRYDLNTGTNSIPRQQINEITSYIDGSMVYGSDNTRATALRATSGGRLLTSAGNLLPFNTMGLPNGTGGNPNASQYFVAGDVRANEQVGLTAVQTLFVREHNYWADNLAAANPSWTNEQIYQRARKIVGAEIQAITYNEFLPALMGPQAPSRIGVYNPAVNVSVLTEFSTAFFRVGHTMLSPTLARVQNNGSPASGGGIPLRNAFFVPDNIANGTELDYLLKGLASQRQQEVDNQIVDDVRNFLFGEPLVGGFDLASLNIQRGRDHGLPDYNSLRVVFGLPAVSTFSDITSDPTIQAKLQSLYGSVNDIDPWVGALAEDHLFDDSLGPLLTAALDEQFRLARDGDRFWYQLDPDFSPADLALIGSTRLSDIIRRNSGITNIQDNVFFVPEPVGTGVVLCMLGAACMRMRRPSRREAVAKYVRSSGAKSTTRQINAGS